MLVIEQDAVDRPDFQGAYVDGSLEPLRELAVTNDLDTALPRLSAIMAKMLPGDALRMACFDHRGQLVVNASTADVPDITTSDGEEVNVDKMYGPGEVAPPRRHIRRSGWSASVTGRWPKIVLLSL